MRIAVIADVHGNVRALEAVLRDLKGRGADRTVHLGDCVSGPLEAGATMDILMGLDWPTIRGNHDRWVVSDDPNEMGRSDVAARAQLTNAHVAWLKALPATMTLDGMLLCHGSPTNDLCYLTEAITPQGNALRAEADIVRDLGDCAAPLILCAHTHVPRLVRLKDGRTIFNPGSVGTPAYRDEEPAPHHMETGSPHARYGIVEQTRDGWRFEHHMVAYDWDAAAATAMQAGRPDWAHALATGFAIR
jgi:predicted phosphodiesterase